MLNIHTFNLNFINLKPDLSVAFFSFFFDGVKIDDISCLISSRCCGDMIGSRTNPHRLRLFDALGMDNNAAFLRQIHSKDVIEVNCGNVEANTAIEADGLVTRDQDLKLSVTVADCLPVYLYDTLSQGFAVLHSGWKGTGIVINALDLMKEKFGTRPEAVAAVLGPCIQSCCYKVDAERAHIFNEDFGRLENEYPLGPVIITREDRYYLNMQAANASLLAGAGVRNIAVNEDCTFTDSRLGSFRREGEVFTRMIAMTGYFQRKF